MADKVQECKYSIFCPIWAEWKCVKLKEKIHNNDICENCGLFDKRKLDEKMPDCHCETCENSVKDE